MMTFLLVIIVTSKMLKFLFTQTQNFPFTGKISLFLFKSHHFRTYLITLKDKIITNKNNISRPVHDLPRLPCHPTTPSSKSGKSRPPTPRIEVKSMPYLLGFSHTPGHRPS